MLYKEWLAIWLRLYIKPKVKLGTYERYGDIIRRRIEPELGDCEMEELTAIKLQRFVVGLTNCGKYDTQELLSANTVNAVISVIKSSLKTAESIGAVDRQYADKIQRPRSKEKAVECLSVKEQKMIEHYVLSCRQDKLFGVVLCLYTGLRIGDLLALTWDDVDFTTAVLLVDKTCRDASINGRYVRLTDAPKTLSSRRVIPLPKQLLPYLKDVKRRSHSQYVVSGSRGVVSVRSYQRTFTIILRKLKLPHKGFHALRHTFATRALECCMDVRTLAEVLGHKNPSVTLSRYAHSMFTHKAVMMNKVGKLL